MYCKYWNVFFHLLPPTPHSNTQLHRLSPITSPSGSAQSPTKPNPCTSLGTPLLLGVSKTAILVWQSEMGCQKKSKFVWCHFWMIPNWNSPKSSFSFQEWLIGGAQVKPSLLLLSELAKFIFSRSFLIPDQHPTKYPKEPKYGHRQKFLSSKYSQRRSEGGSKIKGCKLC